jgi:predicted MPP superfamily phosphohydrolase
MEVFNLGEELGKPPLEPSKLMGEKEKQKRLKKEHRMLFKNIPPAHKDLLTKTIEKYPLKAWLPRLMYKIHKESAKQARRNSFKFNLNYKSLHIPSLENHNNDIRGLKFLHISDLHCDISPYFGNALKRFLQQHKEEISKAGVQMALITGDFQEKYRDETTNTLKTLKQILPQIPCPILGVLGNHDRLELADQIAQLDHKHGIRMLLNNSICFRTPKGKRIHIQGCDDPYYYKSHKIAQKEGEDLNILLAHSPEIYKEAASKKIDICLSGHTHGGQIRVPILGAITNRAPIPRKLIQGTWAYKNLKGHTSIGVGCSTLSLRINCPPEITIIEVK